MANLALEKSYSYEGMLPKFRPPPSIETELRFFILFCGNLEEQFESLNNNDNCYRLLIVNFYFTVYLLAPSCAYFVYF